MRIVRTTIDDKEKAEEISERLVEERLVACVNIIPVRSVYRWKNKIEKEDEFVMTIKTRENLVDDVIERIKQLHPYELPVIEVVHTEKANEEAEQWLNEVTK